MGETHSNVPHMLEQHFCLQRQSLSTSQKCPSHKLQFGSVCADWDGGHVPGLAIFCFPMRQR
jgi:hypothetical protein